MKIQTWAGAKKCVDIKLNPVRSLREINKGEEEKNDARKDCRKKTRHFFHQVKKSTYSSAG